MLRRHPRLALLIALLACRAGAEPMDLQDPEPRRVSVRFEISPSDVPGQTDRVYSSPLLASLVRDPASREVRLRIAGRDVEEQLLRDLEPVPGSFSDFVWSFDAATGHVRRASLTGRIVRRLDLGIARPRVEVDVEFHMDTTSSAGFRRPRHLMGQLVHHFCRPGDSAECQPVSPTPYRRETGYVNAVGRIDVSSRLTRLSTFSTLGEAIFSELEPREAGLLAALERPRAPLRSR